MSNYQAREASISACPSFVAAMGILGQRWNGLILQAIGEGCVGFAEIGRYAEGLSDAMLSRRLRELEDEGLVLRTVFDGRPPRAQYTLSDAGLALVPILDSITTWGETHMPSAPMTIETKENDD